MPDPQLTAATFDKAIRNPAEPNHLMVLKEIPRRIRIYAGTTLLADTTKALRLMEIGRSVYDPVIYVPETDLACVFESIDKSTRCPIKGDARYVGLDGEELGWVYKRPLAMARQLSGHHAFWPSKVRVVEGE